MKLQQRHKRLVNTDPQRRCYDGCHYSSELRWDEWETLDYNVKEGREKEVLKFWRDLSDYAVSQRGESATTEYRIVE